MVLFQELLSRRTSIPLHNQELLYEGRRLILDPNRQAKTFPQTSRDNPIMLVSRESVTTVGLIFEDRRSLPAASAEPLLHTHSDLVSLGVQRVHRKSNLAMIWIWMLATLRYKHLRPRPPALQSPPD